MPAHARAAQRAPTRASRRAGYYARVAAIRQLVLRFLAAGAEAERAPPVKQARPPRWLERKTRTVLTRFVYVRLRVQVVSLGAGFDTLFFGLAAAGVAPARFVEVDFAEARRSQPLSGKALSR
jgi:hypothetical protein